jgi:hypothetical protein
LIIAVVALVFALVAALSSNAFAGFASAGGGARSAVPVKVVSSISFEQVDTHPENIAAGQEGEAKATCPEGTYRVAGGFHTVGTFNYVVGGPPFVTTSIYTPTGWAVRALNSKAGLLSLLAGAVCAEIKYATVMSG